MKRLIGLILISTVVFAGCTSFQTAPDSNGSDEDGFVGVDVIYDNGQGDANTGSDARDVLAGDAADVNVQDVKSDSSDTVDNPDGTDVSGDDDGPDAGDASADTAVDVFEVVTGSLYYRDNVNVGHVAAGSEVPYSTIVQNVSDVPVSVGPVVFAGGACQWLSVNPVEVRQLQPDESVEISGLLSPDAAASAGACVGKLVLTTDLAELPEVEINVTGQVTRPSISVFPSVADLQLVNALPGCHSVTTLNIENTGEGPMWINAISFTGPTGLEITMSGVPATLPVSLAAGGGLTNIQLSFSFDPATVGDYTGILYVTTDALNTSVLEIPVSGSSRECGAGTHQCSCTCFATNSVDACGTSCVPCEPAMPGGQPACIPSGDSYACDTGCGAGFHACGPTCKADNDPNACGAACTLCFARANSTRACVDGVCALDCNDGYDDCNGGYNNGCETSLNLPSSCGECGRQCTAPLHGIPTCTNMECTFACVSGYHPDGAECVINNIDSCCGDNGVDGACVNCAFMTNPMPSNTTGTCIGLIDFNCEMICQDGWFSTSGGINDGCECHFVSNFDQPGNGIDEDCDGNDGEPDLAFYVSTTGSDVADGSRAAPFRTIQKGINMAKAAFVKKRVFIAAGTYQENLVVDGPISLLGGFSTDGNWTFSTSNTTTLVALAIVGGRIMAIDGSNMTTETWISGLNIVAGASNQSDNGADVYGIKCFNCAGLGVVNVNIQAGPGGNHVATAAAPAGAAGGNGGAGGYYVTPGTAGTSGCGREGGLGGTGGYYFSSGYAGFDGLIVGAGGGAGGFGGWYDNADDGGTGASCSVVGGDSDGAKTIGAAAGGYWVGTAGTPGVAGCSGHGGGGGGGGSGYDSGDYYEDGGGGGGGGAGGCGGPSGPGGKAGGASLGIFFDNSTGATVVDCVISAANAGNGAIGGQGGAGGAGGTGGVGNQGSAGWSGDGGRGGSGSGAGYGGGGAGGVSFAVYTSNTALTLPGTNVLSHGAPGVGGSTKGTKNAVDGVSGDFN